MNPRIKIKTLKVDGGYLSGVTVNDEFRASAFSFFQESAVRAAEHYAAQIEFDEWGNW